MAAVVESLHYDSMMPDSGIREHLLRGVSKFVESASKLDGVLRIALIGSLATPKENPKDADLLVTIEDHLDIEVLAKSGRRLKGWAQHRNTGADIFLCNPEGAYLGRTCSFKDCHPRVRCAGTQCGFGSRVCTDFEVVRLPQGVLSEPPIELWPRIVTRGDVPEDVENLLFSLASTPNWRRLTVSFIGHLTRHPFLRPQKRASAHMPLKSGDRQPTPGHRSARIRAGH